MPPKKFGRRTMIVDSAKAATLMRLDTTSPQATTHNPLSLGSTVADIFDISPGQTLSSDTSASRGDIIIMDSTPNWTILAHPGTARHLQTDATDVIWAQNVTMGASAWVGLGGAAGRVEFDSDPATDEFNVLAANVGINTSAPARRLHVVDSSGSVVRLEYNGSNYADLDVSANGDLVIEPIRDIHLSGSKVGINASAPGRRLHIIDSSGSLVRVEYDGSNYADFDVSASGDLIFEPIKNIHLSGSKVGINSSSPNRRLHVTDSSGSTVRFEYDASNYADLDIGSGGNLTVAPTGDFIFDPTGDDILPETGYDLNIGLLNKKYLTLHVAELWVETLVAQDTIATIGGRILVGPTTQLTRDLGSAGTTMHVKHNEMSSGDIAHLEAQGHLEFMQVTSAATLAGTDVVTNGDFEIVTGDDFDDWTEYSSDGAVEDEGSLVHGGSHAVKITAGASVDSRLSQSLTVKSGRRYVMKFWTRGDGTHDGRYAVYDATNGRFIIALTGTGITGTTYTEVEIAFVAPEDCVLIYLQPYCPDTDTGVCYFDDWSVQESEYSYTVTRNLDGTGANNWWAGDAVFNTGQAGDGFMDLYSVHGISASANTTGPTIAGNVRSSSTYNDWSEHWAIGNLNGLYGYSAASYGVGLGRYADGYEHVTIDETNGVRFFTDTDVVEGQLSASKWTLGRVSDDHITIHPDAIYFYDGLTPTGYWAGSLLRIGRAGSANIKISNADGIQIREGGTVEAQLSASTWTLGRTANQHLRIETSSVQFKDAAAIDGLLSASKWTLGRVSDDHITIHPDAIYFYDGLTPTGYWAGSLLRIGRAGSANVLISNAGGIQIREGGTVKGEWQQDGDIFIGSDVSSAASTYFSVFATAQTYNSESVGAGDMMIGDNSASMANIFWDQSAEKLLFRGGTASQVAINTDGELVWGDGVGRAASDGIFVTPTTAYADVRAYGFESGGSIVSGLEGLFSPTTNYLRLRARENSGRVSNLYLEAAGSTNQGATVGLAARYDDNTYSTRLELVQSTTTPGEIGIYGGDVKINVRDLRVGGGLVLGSTIIDPPTGGLCIDDGITAPTASAGTAIIYVDTADGNLKVRFGDGTTTTIATD